MGKYKNAALQLWRFRSRLQKWKILENVATQQIVSGVRLITRRRSRRIRAGFLREVGISAGLDLLVALADFLHEHVHPDKSEGIGLHHLPGCQWEYSV